MNLKFRRLKASEVEARVAQVKEKWLSVLLYKDARVDQNILDETVGPENWQRSHELIGNNLYCTVSIWDKDKEQWIGKQDVGTESNMEAQKGQASDSFKRACFNWGIGRELYTAPFIRIDLENGIDKYTKFDVQDIDYDEDGNINLLRITVNNKVVYEYINDFISEKEQVVLKNLCEKVGLDVGKTFPQGLASLNAKQYVEALKKLENLKAKHEDNQNNK